MNIFRFSNYLTPSGLASVAISNKQTNFDIPLCAINIVSVFIQLLTLCKLANSSFFPPPSKVHQGNTSLCTYRYLHGSASQLGSVSQLRGKSYISLHFSLILYRGSPPYSNFGTWKKMHYAKFALDAKIPHLQVHMPKTASRQHLIMHLPLLTWLSKPAWQRILVLRGMS